MGVGLLVKEGLVMRKDNEKTIEYKLTLYIEEKIWLHAQLSPVSYFGQPLVLQQGQDPVMLFCHTLIIYYHYSLSLFIYWTLTV